jgi:hypothetical protein
MILILITYFIYSKYKKSTKEAFSMYEDDSRIIRYGDIITIWSPSVNKFIQADPTVGNKMKSGIPMGKINLSNSLISPEDIPSTMDWVQYTIIDARDPGDLGNTSTVKYGSPVFLRTVNLQDETFLPTYISPNKDNNVYMSAQRYEGDPKKSEQILIFESASGLQDSEIEYGDMIIIKTWRTDMKYIHVSRANDIILSDSSAITRNFYMYDRFGQGRNIDWARKGTTIQSSTNNNLYSQFAIDGNILTFSSTSKQEKPWWEVILPKDIIISKIVISNTNDSTHVQLSDFGIKLIDFDNTSVDTKIYNSIVSPKYYWENVNQIARKVRIMCNTNTQLNIADVRVYGQAVNYSILLNEEMNKNLILNEQFDLSKNIEFKHRTLPKVSNDMTIMFLLELNKLPTKTSNILVKTKNIDKNRTPNLLIQPPKLNTDYCTLQYCVSTSAGNNEMGENFLINYNVVPNKKFHFTAVHDAGINKNNGWKPCKFSSKSSLGDSTYLCNFSSRELYKIILEDSTVFKNEPVIQLDDPNSYGFVMKGLYNDDNSIPIIKIYINGLLNTTYNLKSTIKQNVYPLIIGAFDKYPGFEGNMSFLKFSNRVIPQEYIQKESQILTGKLSIQLLPNTTRVTTNNIVKIDPNYLPEINPNNPEYTINFWLKSQRPITGTGNEESIFKYGKEGLYFNSDKNTLFSKTNLGEIGIDDSNYKIDVDRWIHIAYVIKDNNVNLFVNSKKVANKSLIKNDIKTNNFSIINIGGFNGFIGKFEFSNYGLSEKDIWSILNNGPNSDSIDKVRQFFNKSGCTIDPIDITDPYIDNYNTTWLNFADKNDDTKLTQSITDFKKLADDGIVNEDIIKLKLAEKCYGKVDTSNRVQLNRNKKQLGSSSSGSNNTKDGVMCLPKAPFTCKKYNINDFDIRTHQNFPKYIEKSKIIAPPKQINTVTTLPPDPLKYVSTSFVEQNFVEKSKIANSPDYVQMQQKVNDMSKQITEMNKLKELVAKCQMNNDTISKMDTNITDMKAIANINPNNNKIHTDIKHFNNELITTKLAAQSDTKKLIGKLSKIPLKTSVEKTISSFDNTNRIIPFSSENGLALNKETIDLDNLQKRVEYDIVSIEKKLDAINKKLSNQNMSDLEISKLSNKISSIKQNKLPNNY